MRAALRSSTTVIEAYDPPGAADDVEADAFLAEGAVFLAVDFFAVAFLAVVFFVVVFFAGFGFGTSRAATFLSVGFGVAPAVAADGERRPRARCRRPLSLWPRPDARA